MNEQSIGKNWRSRLVDGGADDPRADRDGERLGPGGRSGGGAGGGRGGFGGGRGPGGDTLPPPQATDLADTRGVYLSDAYMTPATFAGSGGDNDLNLRKYVALLPQATAG